MLRVYQSPSRPPPSTLAVTPGRRKYGKSPWRSNGGKYLMVGLFLFFFLFSPLKQAKSEHPLRAPFQAAFHHPIRGTRSSQTSCRPEANIYRSVLPNLRSRPRKYPLSYPVIMPPCTCKTASVAHTSKITATRNWDPHADHLTLAINP